MNIALISQPFDVIIPPSMNSIGIWVNEISRRLAQNHQVTVYGRRGVTSRKGIGEKVKTKYTFSLPNSWLTNLSSRVSDFLNSKKPLFSSPVFYLEYILPIALDLKQRQVDIVHLQNYSQFVPIIRAFNPDIKIALHMRCEWLALLDYKMINKRLEKTDMIMGVSKNITGAIRNRFPQHTARCFTSYTGVDINAFKPLAPSADRSGHGRRILFVGRVTPEKGTHVLIEAFKKIAYRFPDLQLDVVGSISSLARDRLVGLSEEKLISDLDVFYSDKDYHSYLKDSLPPDLENRVHFLGHVSYAKTIDYYQHSHILINPALSEPFGRSLIEANACGVPTIATNVGGMTELIEQGKNGLLVKPGDADELADAISSLLDNEPRRLDMGMAGRQFVVKNFSWESITSNLLSIYEDVLSADRFESGQLTKWHAH